MEPFRKFNGRGKFARWRHSIHRKVYPTSQERLTKEEKKKFGKSSGSLVNDTVSRNEVELNALFKLEEGCLCLCSFTHLRHASRRIFLKYSIVSGTKFGGGILPDSRLDSKFGEITAKQLFLPSATFVFRATNPKLD